MTSAAATVARQAGGQEAQGDARPPIDRAYLSRFTLGNAALEREVLDLFAEHAPSYLNQLETAANPKAWREAAHTLKGSARAVGAWQVAAAAERAEAMTWPLDEAGRTAAVAALSDALDAARHHIADLAAGA